MDEQTSAAAAVPAPATPSAAARNDSYDYTKFIDPAEVSAGNPAAAIPGQDGSKSSAAIAPPHPQVVERVEEAPMFPEHGRDDSPRTTTDKNAHAPVLPSPLNSTSTSTTTSAPAITRTTPAPPPAKDDPTVKSIDQVDEKVYGKQPDEKKGDGKSGSDQKGPRSEQELAQSKDPKPDLVLVFELPKPDASQQEWRSAQEEYDQLKRILARTGFKMVAMPGGKDKDERLLLLKATTTLVTAEAQAEKLTDWLQSVKGVASRDSPHQMRDFRAEPIRSAERTRFVNNAFERATHSDVIKRPFPRLKYYFPPHDAEFNSAWLKNWSSLKLRVTEEELGEIRDHFGDAVALYFQFLRGYFMALAIPSFIGITTWLGGFHFSRLYSVLLVLWSLIFVEGWKLRERQLSVRWGNYQVASTHGKVRIGFKAEAKITSPVTGEEVPYSPWWRRELRVAASIPALLGFAALLAGIISVIFCVEVIINEVYNGPGKQFLALVPTMLFAVIVPQVVGLWHTTAKEITFWENHPTEVGHERSLTLKMFALNALMSYGSLLLTAYVYLPFGHFIIPRLVSLVRGKISEDRVSSSSLSSPGAFTASSERLTNTLFALMTTTQAIGAFTEVGLPYLQRKFAEYQNAEPSSSSHKNEASKKQGKLTNMTVAQEEKGWLQYIREQVDLPEYSLFTDYAEMAVQFGHVVLFSTAWPLAPLAAFINNFFELRGDAFKLCVNSRRPVPVRTDTIGPWIEALSLITWIGALTNASLVYLLRPLPIHYSSETSLSKQVGQAVEGNFTATTLNPSFQHTRITNDANDWSGTKATLLGALLCALASEHAFLLARFLVRHLLEKVLWHGSDEEVHLRHTDYRLKREYVDSLGAKSFEDKVADLYRRSGDDAARQDDDGGDGFWNAQDKGIREEVDKKRQ